MRNIRIMGSGKRPFAVQARDEVQLGSRVELWLHDKLEAFIEWDWKSGRFKMDVADEDVSIRVMNDVDDQAS